METLQTGRLFKIVAGPGLLFALLSSVPAFAIFRFITDTTFSRGVGVTIAIIAPDLFATWWIFRRLRLLRTANTARRAATAFAFSAPIALAIAYPLGTLVGAYAEVFLGRVFVIPVIILFIAILMVTIPGVIERWALHPSGGVSRTNEGTQ
jgi:hypothetical protein